MSDMKLSAKQIESVLALSGEERYKHFVKRVADTELVWGLFNNGWALAATDDGRQVFPMWPAREYAEISAVDEWMGYKPREFSVEELVGELLPRFRTDGTLPGIFYTPNDKGVTPPLDLLSQDISDELQKYD